MASQIQDRLTTDQDLLLMQEGMMMRKVRTRFWKKLRFFRLQNDGMTVWHAQQADDVAKPTFSISDVETIRKGHDSELLRNLMEEFPLEQGFTIVFHGRRPNLDLVASSVEEAQIWMRGLQLLVELVASMDHQEQLDQYQPDELGCGQGLLKGPDATDLGKMGRGAETGKPEDPGGVELMILKEK